MFEGRQMIKRQSYFSCHVEPLKGSGEIDYLTEFLMFVGRIKHPVYLLLMVGEGAEDKVLNFFKKNRRLVPKNCTLGLHVHKVETEKAIRMYKSVFGNVPQFISFGHWQVTPQDLKIAARLGVKYDLSHVAYRHNERFFFKKPFRSSGLVNLPVTCDPRYPINPLTSSYHLLLYLLFSLTNSRSHYSFHSFDIKAPFWRKKFLTI